MHEVIAMLLEMHAIVTVWHGTLLGNPANRAAYKLGITADLYYIIYTKTNRNCGHMYILVTFVMKICEKCRRFRRQMRDRIHLPHRRQNHTEFFTIFMTKEGIHTFDGIL